MTTTTQTIPVTWAESNYGRHEVRNKATGKVIPITAAFHDRINAACMGDHLRGKTTEGRIITVRINARFQ